MEGELAAYVFIVSLLPVYKKWCMSTTVALKSLLTLTVCDFSISEVFENGGDWISSVECGDQMCYKYETSLLNFVYV